MLPFKISVLVFLRNSEDELLLIERAKQPNRGCWSPIGGKLEMSAGESPFQTAIRETREETGLEVSERDLHLFCMISEKGYEASTHWLMFLFDCLKPLDTFPPSMEEGPLSFFPGNGDRKPARSRNGPSIAVAHLSKRAGGLFGDARQLLPGDAEGSRCRATIKRPRIEGGKNLGNWGTTL